jgi:hypothetical protein
MRNDGTEQSLEEEKRFRSVKYVCGMGSRTSKRRLGRIVLVRLAF